MQDEQKAPTGKGGLQSSRRGFLKSMLFAAASVALSSDELAATASNLAASSSRALGVSPDLVDCFIRFHHADMTLVERLLEYGEELKKIPLTDDAQFELRIANMYAELEDGFIGVCKDASRMRKLVGAMSDEELTHATQKISLDALIKQRMHYSGKTGKAAYTQIEKDYRADLEEIREAVDEYFVGDNPEEWRETARDIIHDTERHMRHLRLEAKIKEAPESKIQVRQRIAKDGYIVTFPPQEKVGEGALASHRHHRANAAAKSHVMEALQHQTDESVKGQNIASGQHRWMVLHPEKGGKSEKALKRSDAGKYLDIIASDAASRGR